MIFNPKKLSHYAITLFLIVMVSSVAKKLSKTIHPSDEEELIRNYLLNESPLYGYNRPKLWIHSKYEINARNWKDFGSRNTTDLNQISMDKLQGSNDQNVVLEHDVHVQILPEQGIVCSETSPEVDAKYTEMDEKLQSLEAHVNQYKTRDEKFSFGSFHFNLILFHEF
jgi:hypothetical protein